jgi:hypothetical protein
MYVADVTDVKELEELLAEAKDRLIASGCERAWEQAAWDIEDIEDRIDELMFESRYPKLTKLMSRPTPFEESI